MVRIHYRALALSCYAPSGLVLYSVYSAEREESTFSIFFSFYIISPSYNMLWTKQTHDCDPLSLLKTLVVVT